MNSAQVNGGKMMTRVTGAVLSSKERADLPILQGDVAAKSSLVQACDASSVLKPAAA